MNRFEYMRRLEELLADISPSEKEEALTYYNDYFNDAGEENEQLVIEELGTPEQVAAVVKEGLGLGPANGQPQQSIPEASQQQTQYQGQPVQGATQQKKGMPGWAITLIVIGLVFCSPVLLALLCVVFALVIAVFSVVFGLIIAFGASTLALYGAAIVCFLLGIFICPVSGLLAGALLGTGFLAAAIGILFMLLTVLSCMSVPALCKGTAWLWRKLFHKR